VVSCVDWFQLLLAEESARAAAREAKNGQVKAQAPVACGPKPHPQQYARPSPPQQTYIYERTNRTSSLGGEKLLWVDGKSGKIEEMVIRCTTSGFSLDIMVDNSIDMTHTWTEFNDMSTDIDSITTVHRAGEYVLSLTDLYFTNRAHIMLHGPDLLFTKLYVRVRYD